MRQGKFKKSSAYGLLEAIFGIVYLILFIPQAEAREASSIASNVELANDLWRIDDHGITIESVYHFFLDEIPTEEGLVELSQIKPTVFSKQNFGKVHTVIASVINHSNQTKAIYFSHFVRANSRFFSLYDNKISKLNKIFNQKDATKIILQPGKTKFIFYYENNVINFADKIYGLTFLAEKDFYKNKHDEHHIRGILYGIATLLMLYSLISFISWRRNYFLYYTLYIASSASIFATLDGYFDFHIDRIFILSTIHTIFCMLFINNVLSIQQNSKALLYFMFIVLTCIVAFGIFTYVSLKDPFTFLSIGFLPITYMCIASLVRYKQGNKESILFIFGYMAFTIGALGTALQKIYLDSITSALPAMVSWLIELIFFKLAVDTKIKNSEKRANSHSMHAFKQLEKVVYPHQIKQIKSGKQIENTMPVHASEACVISFDIISSSKIEGETAKQFLRSLFKSCNEAMIEKYNETTLVSDGFRIKEMGDGFLCSVGYPFTSLTDNIANDAISLAYRFHEILTEKSQMLATASPICCGIGIAFGRLQGFFPEGGTKEYDIYGPGLILATRYENLRKFIRPADCQSSIIICQKKVIDLASREFKKNFDKFDLNAINLKVRDDPSADYLYIQYLHEKNSQSKDINETAV